MVRIESTSKDLNSVIGEVLENSGTPVTHLNIVYYEQDNGGYVTKTSPLHVDLVESSKIRGLDKLPNKNNNRIGLSSLVRLDNGCVAHLKQLDLDWGVHADLEILFQKIGNLRLDKETGYLVNTGKGNNYHYYGFGLLNPEEWKNWMKRAEDSEEVDKEWIKLSRERGYSVLRINSAEGKPLIPRPFCKITF